MQIFKKHAKLTYLCIWKTMLQSVILLWKCLSVFVMVCEPRPMPVYPIVFRHAGLPVGVKHSVFHAIHRHVCSFLFGVVNRNLSVCQIWGGGVGWKNLIFFNPSQFYTVISILVNSTLFSILVNSTLFFNPSQFYTTFHQSWSILHNYSNPSQFYTISSNVVNSTQLFKS